MIQSIWQTELGKKFKRVETDLEQNWRKMDEKTLKNRISNLEKGLEQLNFLAISSNFPEIKRKEYDFDYTIRQQIGEQSKNEYKKIIFLEVKNEKIGLFEGKSCFQGGIPIFNHNDFVETFINDDPLENFDRLIKIVKEFEAMPAVM